MMRLVHGLVMRLYPGSFREAWGAELRWVAREAERSARSSGGRAAVLRTRAWLVWDAMASLPGAWREAKQRRQEAREAETGGAGPGGGRGGRQRGPARWLDLLRQDMGFTLGLWRRSPLFTAFAVSTLALGMGSVVAIFSGLNGILLRPMPYAGADRVVNVQSGDGFGWTVSWADLEDMKSFGPLDGVVGWIGWRAGFKEPDGTVSVRHSASVTADFFSMLAVQPALGRVFTAEDAADQADGRVVISWSAWQTDFGGRPDIIGTEVVIDERTYAVQGVLPRRFIDPLGFPVNGIETSMFRVMSPPPAAVQVDRTRRGFFAVARLRENVDGAQAATRLTDELKPQYEALGRSPVFALQRIQDMHVSNVKPTLTLLTGAVALLLLIGCANAANLLLSRATVRRRELTVRGALGASRSRLVAQLLTESAMLALVAGLIGTWIGYFGARALVLLGGETVPRANDVRIDGMVVLVTFGVALLTAGLFGMAPALQWSRISFASGLRGSERGTSTAASGKRLRNVLVVVETALAVMLTFGAGLLARSLWKLQHVDPGYDAENVLTLRATLTPARYSPERRVQMHQEMVEAIERVPGVVAAAAITYHPLSGGSLQLPVSPGGEPTRETPTADIRSITPGYFQSMGIDLLAGRVLAWGDRAGSEPVVVVNQTFARNFLGEGDPVGRAIHLPGQAYRVIGVVRDVKEYTLREGGSPVVYLTYGQTPQNLVLPTSTITVRGNGNALDLTRGVRAAIREIDATVPVAFFRTMRTMMDIDLLAPRMRTVLIGTFGVLAALLAAIGLAGVMAYTVTQSIPEIGVRMALGARERDVAGRVLGSSLGLTLLGVAIGLTGALATSRLIASMLFGTAANEPAVAIAVGGLTLLLAGAASWYPAHRAARVDPATVLRSL
jgi:putative ABC transport system permease protein